MNVRCPYAFAILCEGSRLGQRIPTLERCHERTRWQVWWHCSSTGKAGGNSMARGMDASEGMTVIMDEVVAVRPPRRTTTLYELLAAIQDVMGPEEDALVVATIQHLLQSGQ